MITKKITLTFLIIAILALISCDATDSLPGNNSNRDGSMDRERERMEMERERERMGMEMDRARREKEKTLAGRMSK